MNATRRALLLGAVAATALACGRREGARCRHCGMRVPPDSRWRAGARAADGAALVFDTPGCLHRFRLSPPGAGMRDPWVVEYYGPTERQTDATSVRYVAGSRVRGPMGPDVIPLAPESVDRFRRDHGGREPLGFLQITQAILDAMD
jgi:copper chaperone NosL